MFSFLAIGNPEEGESEKFQRRNAEVEIVTTVRTANPPVEEGG